jgi:hypothetical protein
MAQTTLKSHVPAWLPDDTEESVKGTEWHQEAIGALAMTLRVVAARRGVPWGVCEMIEMTGLRRADGSRYSPRPDMLVLPRPLPGQWSAFSLAEIGTPYLIMEVASASTVRNDLEGKKQVYAAIGVAEYILYDPVGNVLQSPMLAWRLAIPGDTVYTPWVPDAEGWWHSAQLDVAFKPEPPYLRVRDRDGAVLDTAVGAFRRARLLEQTELALEKERAARLALEETVRRLRGESEPSGD